MRLVFLAALAACTPLQDAELLLVEDCQPTSVEPGATLTLSGHGFPSGRRGVAEFDGEYVRPGFEPVIVHVEVEARAPSDERAEAILTEDAVAAFGGRGTFHGRVTLRFEGAGTVVAGRHAVDLDVGDLGVDQLRTRRRMEGAQLEALGIALEEDLSNGLRIAAVTAGGLSERAGLRPGDRLVSLGGLRLRSGADLALPPTNRTLQIVREGVTGELTVALPQPTRSAGSSFWLLLCVPLIGWWIGPGAWSMRAATPKTDRPGPKRLAWLAVICGASVALLGLRSIDVSVWLALGLALRAAALVVARNRLTGLVRELPFWLVIVALTTTTGSTATGPAWGPLSTAPLLAAPLLWGLVVAHLMGLAGRRGAIDDAHRAVTTTVVVALATGGLDLGLGLAAVAFVPTVVTAWLPLQTRKWGWRTAIIVLPLHLAALVWLPAPTFEEAVALALAVVVLPALVLVWPRRAVPRLHGYL